jgi:hypothetical protein
MDWTGLLKPDNSIYWEGIMKKFGWVVLLVLALVMVPAVLTAQVPSSRSRTIDKQPVGNLKIIPADQFNWDAVVGIQKTVNLSPFAFVADPYQEMIYYAWAQGLIWGGETSYAEALANLTFPKGAKKITAIYWMIYTVGTNDCYVGLYKAPWSTANPTQYVGGWNGSTGWQVLYWEPAKPQWPVINPTDTFYIEFYGNGDAALRGCAVAYK